MASAEPVQPRSVQAPTAQSSLKRSRSNASIDNDAHHESPGTGTTVNTAALKADSPATPSDVDAAIHQYFRSPSATYSAAIKHARSTKTRPFHFYDLHLHRDLRLKRIVVLDNLPQTLSQFCDEIIKECHDYLLRAGPLPKTQLEFARDIPQNITNEAQLAEAYVQMNRPYLEIASGLNFKAGWKDVFMIQTPEKQGRTEAIADRILTFNPKSEHFLSAEKLSEIQLLRKYLFDALITWEFKSLVCGPHVINDLPSMEGEFKWTGCEERSRHDEASFRCKSNAHRIDGRLLVTGRQPGLDCTVIQHIIDSSQKNMPKSSKNLRRRGPVEPNRKKDLFFACQQTWTQAVVEGTSILIFSSGNQELVGIRHRETQTLYLSPLIDCDIDTTPSHAKILVACYILAYRDALERARQLENLANIRRLQIDELPHYVLNRFTGNDTMEHERSLTRTQSNDSDNNIILSLKEQLIIPLRFHSSVHSLQLAGVKDTKKWTLERQGFNGMINQSDFDLFLDLEEPLAGQKVFTVFLGAINKTSSSKVPVYYSKPLVVKITRNDIESQALEREYEVYNRLHDKGIKATVQAHGLFFCAEFPSYRILLLEHGGDTLSTVAVLRRNRCRNACIEALTTFHENDIVIKNIMNNHILIDKDNKVSFISLSYASFSPISVDGLKHNDLMAFKTALR